MHFKKISSILEHTAWFLRKYTEQQAIKQNIYRIVEVKQPSSGKYKIVIQIVGKSTVIECTPHEIVTNDRMLEGFSKKDIRAITYFACHQRKNPSYKIIKQEFSDKLNKILFKLIKYDNNEVILKTAAQISVDKNLINNLSPEDACSISYTAGYEHSFPEKRIHEIEKKPPTNF